MARGKYKGPKRGSGQKNRGTAEEEEDAFRGRAPSGQQGNAGMMPPSDSSSDEETEKPKDGAKQSLNMFAGMGAPGELPPNSSDSESSSDDDSDIQPHGAAPAKAPPPRRRKKEDDETDPEQIAKDMERLKLIKEKREEQRQARIKTEGWDRFAPVTATNKPPDGRPVDHPDFKK